MTSALAPPAIAADDDGTCRTTAALQPSSVEGLQAKVEDDPSGTYLPDAEAALSYANHIIAELQKKSGYAYNNDPALMMIVKNEARQTVLSLPFSQNWWDLDAAIPLRELNCLSFG